MQSLDVLKNIVNNISQLAQDQCSDLPQHLADRTLQISLNELVKVISFQVVPTLHHETLSFVLDHAGDSIDLASLKDEATQMHVMVLLEGFAVLLETLKLFHDFELKQEEYFKLYSSSTFVGMYFKRWDRFYIDWIVSFQNRDVSRSHLVTIARTFYFSYMNGVLTKGRLEQPSQEICYGSSDESSGVNEPSKMLSESTVKSLNLLKMYKIFLSKLDRFNEKVLNNNSRTSLYGNYLLLLDPSLLPRIRYHKTPHKHPSLYRLGYSKHLYIIPLIDFEMSFEERRAADLVMKDCKGFDHDYNYTKKNIVELLTCHEGQFQNKLISLSSYMKLSDEWCRQNVTLLREQRQDPHDLIHSINVSSDPLIESTLVGESSVIDQ
ncbi:hypothetical protein C9374_002318 [Naegleria lovaniensis]|uniref:Uncharacterized protein n=1 Tax=Naegleria lovaniensis TaxID=51637 RepID=A0AA88KM56_NAELO|nr:uncharacterized protein C9374_002318 [Naegleria lovaniensis]KAG2386574.1 hypothetical protein C9374_002318 [Naegleria lovaniensis]